MATKADSASIGHNGGPPLEPLDVLWGAKAIGKAIGRNERQTFGMLEAGELPAKKVKGRWASTRQQTQGFHGGFFFNP